MRRATTAAVDRGVPPSIEVLQGIRWDVGHVLQRVGRHPMVGLHFLDQNLLDDMPLLKILLLLDSVDEAVQISLRVGETAVCVKLLNVIQLLVELSHRRRMCRQSDP